MRMLVKTAPYSEVTPADLGWIVPGYEVECDADKEEVRLYRILTDIMIKKKKKRIGKGKLWIEVRE